MTKRHALWSFALPKHMPKRKSQNSHLFWPSGDTVPDGAARTPHTCFLAVAFSRLAHYVPSAQLQSFSATRTEFRTSFCHMQRGKKERNETKI